MNEKKLYISKKPPKGEDGNQTFSIRIKDEIFEQLEKLVDETGRTRNELIGILLAYALENCEVEEQ